MKLMKLKGSCFMNYKLLWRTLKKYHVKHKTKMRIRISNFSFYLKGLCVLFNLQITSTWLPLKILHKVLNIPCRFLFILYTIFKGRVRVFRRKKNHIFMNFFQKFEWSEFIKTFCTLLCTISTTFCNFFMQKYS